MAVDPKEVDRAWFDGFREGRKDALQSVVNHSSSRESHSHGVVMDAVGERCWVCPELEKAKKAIEEAKR